nr:type VI secretion system lipoprotein TssJ [Caballeronia sp. BR00000012568055]
MKMFKRYSAILTLLLCGCGAWQAASDSTSNAYDTMFHNRGKTINIDLSASDTLNQDSAGRSRSVAVRVYQLKDRKRFDDASYADLVAKDTTVLASDVQSSMAAVVNPGGAISVSQPMMRDTKFVAVAAFYPGADKAGSWKQVIKSKTLSKDEPLKLLLADKTLSLIEETKSGTK